MLVELKKEVKKISFSTNKIEIKLMRHTHQEAIRKFAYLLLTQLYNLNEL